ncbi:MAG: ABC-type Mn2+/Zn2+ transport system, permease component [Actinomycetia bacterium]|nr:ABC-type Mn2+/Zn2+ transport system, permease component [Actinomycetes bacterium]
MTVIVGALPLPWPFEREYMQLALAAGLTVGACAPLIGAFLVQKRMSLMGDGIGHLAFAGVAAGLLANVWPIWTALIAAVIGAVAIEWLRSHGRASGDLALALFFYGGIAGGAVLVSRAGAGSTNVLPYLFGSVLTATRGDVAIVMVLGVCIVLTLLVTGRALFAIVLDEESARVSGLPVDTLNTLLAALTAITIVAAMRVVGVLLVAALMVLPVATSRLVARSFRATLVGATVVGMASVVMGLVAARAWSLAPGGSIVLAVALCFTITAIVASALRLGQGAAVVPTT